MALDQGWIKWRAERPPGSGIRSWLSEMYDADHHQLQDDDDSVDGINVQHLDLSYYIILGIEAARDEFNTYSS